MHVQTFSKNHLFKFPLPSTSGYFSSQNPILKVIGEMEGETTRSKTKQLIKKSLTQQRTKLYENLN